MTKNIFFYSTPIGEIGIRQTNNAITNLYFNNELDFVKQQDNYTLQETPEIKKTAQQVLEYLNKTRQVFDININFDKLSGTEFQKKVWSALCDIKFGETKNYQEIATQINCENGARAVGNANNKNPLPIIIPCHRVIGKSGKLVGFRGGLETKQFLLNLEKTQK